MAFPVSLYRAKPREEGLEKTLCNKSVSIAIHVKGSPSITLYPPPAVKVYKFNANNIDFLQAGLLHTDSGLYSVISIIT